MADGSAWTLRDAVCSTVVFGATGAGKTSSSGMTICCEFLRQGFGGLFLTAKPDDADTYIRYCKETGRLDDLVIIEPSADNKYRFNFLEHEIKNSKNQKAITHNVVELLMTVIEAGSSTVKGTGDADFWLVAVRVLLSNVIDLLLIGTGQVTIEDIYNIVLSLPEPESPNARRSDQEPVVPSAFETVYRITSDKVRAQAATWNANLSIAQKGKFSDRPAYMKGLYDALPEVRIFDYLAEYFFRSFRLLSPKTKATVTYMVTGFLHNLMREPVFSLFCNKPSNINPEDCYNKGKIWLVNLPVKEYHQAGQYCQMLVKYCWQRACEARRITENSLPVFFVADECQHFMLPTDSEIFATSRSSLICNLQLTQNLPNLYISVGGDKYEYRVKSLLGNFGTKIFHANSCVDTNSWAESLIGEFEIDKSSRSYSFDTDKVGHSRTDAPEFQKIVRKEEFAALKCGGKNNQFKVQAIIHKQGDPFTDGKNFKRVFFSQKITK